MRVYLAGPDVFVPDPLARGAALKAICARHGHEGVFPLDTLASEPDAWQTLPEAFRIARRNEAHIASCDALVANLTPFRGPSADAGTVFELGYARALGKPVHGWSNHNDDFAVRTRVFAGVAGTTDRDGMLIEEFGLADNLMISGAITASGGRFVARACPPERRWSELAAFESVVALLTA